MGWGRGRVFRNMYKRHMDKTKGGRIKGGRGKKHQCVVASRMPPNGDLAHNPGMCPEWE